MLPEYKLKWLPMFSGNGETTTKEHMSIFLALFQLNPMEEDVEYLVMKLFSVILHDDARIWYDSLPNKIIKTMAQFEETFMNRWSTEEEPDILCDMEGEETYKEEQGLSHDSTKTNKDFIEE
jgi:hypothetical protein